MTILTASPDRVKLDVADDALAHANRQAAQARRRRDDVVGLADLADAIAAHQALDHACDPPRASDDREAQLYAWAYREALDRERPVDPPAGCTEGEAFAVETAVADAARSWAARGAE